MSIDQYYREKVKTNKEPLRFQIISWNKFDKEINLNADVVEESNTFDYTHELF